MRKNLKKLLSAAGAAILGILGFTSCDHVLRCEYGTPNCNFKVDLTVQDEAGKPLKDIKVVPVGDGLNGIDEAGFMMSQNKDTISTDASGKAQKTYSLFSPPTKVTIIFEDKDGELNGGNFKKESAEFTPVKTGKGDNNWYSGEYTVSGTVKLKKE